MKLFRKTWSGWAGKRAEASSSLKVLPFTWGAAPKCTFHSALGNLANGGPFFPTPHFPWVLVFLLRMDCCFSLCFLHFWKKLRGPPNIDYLGTVRLQAMICFFFTSENGKYDFHLYQTQWKSFWWNILIPYTKQILITFCSFPQEC